jgi:hypothetical protein
VRVGFYLSIVLKKFVANVLTGNHLVLIFTFFTIPIKNVVVAQIFEA